MSLGTEVIGNLSLWDIIVIFGTIIIAIVVGKLISINLRRAMVGRIQERNLEIFIKILYWAVVVAAVFIIFAQAEIDLSGLLIAGGFLGIVIGIASQSVVGNFLAGIFLLAERPIAIGDEVRIGETEGYVEDIKILSTVIRTYSGIYTRMPNEKVLTTTLTNYIAHPAWRVEYNIKFSQREDMKRVREIILSVLHESPYALVRPEPEVLLSEIAEDRLLVIVWFWTPSRVYWTTRYVVIEEIQAALSRAGIELPPSRRLVTFATERKGPGVPETPGTGKEAS
jgi:small-conductance mechanosensitive channel